MDLKKEIEAIEAAYLDGIKAGVGVVFTNLLTHDEDAAKKYADDVALWRQARDIAIKVLSDGQ